MSLWFEALPSPRDAPSARIERDLDRLVPCNDLVDRILVPEVVDGDHQTVDPFGFAVRAGATAGVAAGAAVLTHERTGPELEARLQQGQTLGLDRLLLVGPPRRGIGRGGGVEAALRANPDRDGLGVVTIPTRRRWRVDEPHRLLAKQRAGAAFALSQIVYHPDDALDVRRELVQSLAPGEEPIPVMYSVAPVRRARDLAFLERLGVRFPPRLHKALRTGSERERLARARAATLATVRSLAARHEDEGLGAFGVCVSHVMVSNVEPALDLAADVRDELRSLQCLQPTTVLA